MIYEGVYRTAPATWGLLKYTTCTDISGIMLSKIDILKTKIQTVS